MWIWHELYNRLIQTRLLQQYIYTIIPSRPQIPLMVENYLSFAANSRQFSLTYWNCGNSRNNRYRSPAVWEIWQNLISWQTISSATLPLTESILYHAGTLSCHVNSSLYLLPTKSTLCNIRQTDTQQNSAKATSFVRKLVSRCGWFLLRSRYVIEQTVPNFRRNFSKRVM